MVNDIITVTHIGFEQSTYSVTEGSQLVQPVIMLSNPISTEFTILIRERSKAATAGKIYIYIYKEHNTSCNDLI